MVEIDVMDTNQGIFAAFNRRWFSAQNAGQSASAVSLIPATKHSSSIASSSTTTTEAAALLLGLLLLLIGCLASRALGGAGAADFLSCLQAFPVVSVCLNAFFFIILFIHPILCAPDLSLC